MHMYPNAHLWLLEQDRERMLAQRALQRAAREGLDQRSGVERGGINAFTRLRAAVSSALHLRLRLGVGGTSIDLTGTSPA